MDPDSGYNGGSPNRMVKKAALPQRAFQMIGMAS